jgi:hypothetical protein
MATSTRALSLARGCPVGAVAVLVPGRLPVLLGPVVSGAFGSAGLSELVYPADASIVRGSGVALDERGCSKDRAGDARAVVRSLSLFDGTVTAPRVDLALGPRTAANASGLAVAGKHVAPDAGTHVPLGNWGYLELGPGHALPAAGGGTALGALSVHLLRPHAGLPAGTVVLVAVAGRPSARREAQPVARARKNADRKQKRHRATHEPLRVTPPLGLPRYVFPVVGASGFSDSYGAFRGDVPGNWHHGDDIFAPLGTPVVAVAGGTINRVGWERLGGWRVWVRDSVGDEFYYAHLSGYAPTDLRTNRVRAGEVIGFVGNTGDAFTTPPHLHFEVHPRPLLHLGYDGAVDPTTYLDHWTRLQHVRAPIPAHPPLPSQPALRREARYVFRELLAARHLVEDAPKPSERPHLRVPPDANELPVAAPNLLSDAAQPRSARRATGSFDATVVIVAALAALGTAALLFGAMLRRRLARRDAGAADESPVEDG